MKTIGEIFWAVERSQGNLYGGRGRGGLLNIRETISTRERVRGIQL